MILGVIAIAAPMQIDTATPGESVLKPDWRMRCPCVGVKWPEFNSAIG
jgi:hypothetical protein